MLGGDYMAKKSSPSCTNDKGQKLHGCFALSYIVYNIFGGVQEYNDAVGESYIKEFVKSISENANSDVQAKINRKQIKKVG